jgi:hypothetical protein
MEVLFDSGGVSHFELSHQLDKLRLGLCEAWVETSLLSHAADLLGVIVMRRVHLAAVGQCKNLFGNRVVEVIRSPMLKIRSTTPANE